MDPTILGITPLIMDEVSIQSLHSRLILDAFLSEFYLQWKKVSRLAEKERENLPDLTGYENIPLLGKTEPVFTGELPYGYATICNCHEVLPPAAPEVAHFLAKSEPPRMRTPNYQQQLSNDQQNRTIQSNQNCFQRPSTTSQFRPGQMLSPLNINSSSKVEQSKDLANSQFSHFDKNSMSQMLSPFNCFNEKNQPNSSTHGTVANATGRSNTIPTMTQNQNSSHSSSINMPAEKMINQAINKPKPKITGGVRTNLPKNVLLSLRENASNRGAPTSSNAKIPFDLSKRHKEVEEDEKLGVPSLLVVGLAVLNSKKGLSLNEIWYFARKYFTNFEKPKKKLSLIKRLQSRMFKITLANYSAPEIYSFAEGKEQEFRNELQVFEDDNPDHLSYALRKPKQWEDLKKGYLKKYRM